MSTRSKTERSLARPSIRPVRNSTISKLAESLEWLTGRRWRRIAPGLALAVGWLPLGAQTTVTWNFSAGTAAASGTVANVATSAMTAGNTASSSAMEVNSTSASNFSGASGTFNAGVRTVTSTALSTTTSTYFQFTLTPTAGYSITATSLSFGTRSTGTGPTAVALYSSADNYLASIASTSVSNNMTWSSVSLSGFTVSGAQDTAVTFRIYGAPAGTAGTANWRIDDVAMTATASAIPEPSTYAAIGGAVALLGAAVWRRKERAAARRGGDNRPVC